MEKQYLIIACISIIIFNMTPILALDSVSNTDTLPSFIFNINLSKKMFVYGESFDVYYETNIENPKISAALTYPNGSVQEISLDEITTSDIGTYEISVTASKEGYRTVTKKEQFEVIEKNDGVKTQNGELAQLNNAKIYIIIFVIIGVTVVGLFVYLCENKKNRNYKNNRKR